MKLYRQVAYINGYDFETEVLWHTNKTNLGTRRQELRKAHGYDVVSFGDIDTVEFEPTHSGICALLRQETN